MNNLNTTERQDRLIYTRDSDGDPVVHVRIATGEFVTVESADWSKLRAIGCDKRWYRVVNPATGKATVAIPSRDARMPLVPLARVILGATPRHRLQFANGAFDLRRKSLIMFELKYAKTHQATKRSEEVPA